MVSLLRSLALVLLVATATGCALTKNRYEKGLKHEDAGRYERAVDYYWKVVNKDPGYEDAAERLAELGQVLVDEYWAEAQAAERAEQFEDAADALDELARLERRLDDVGIRLDVPEAFADFRAGIESAAVAQLLDRGRAAEARADWDRALDAYERALGYPVSARQRRDIDFARATVLLRWAEEDLERGYSRAAFGRAEQGLALLPPDAGDDRPFLALQDAALRDGTRLVAFAPFSESEAVRRAAPRDFTDELNDVLVVDFWTQPPLFLAAADPIEVRRLIRRMDAPRGRLSDRQATDLARTLGTDFVVVGELTELTFTEDVRETDVRRAKTRGRGVADTTYTIERYDLEIEAEVAFTVLDARRGRTVYLGTRSAEVSDRFARGVYAGDLDRLVLDRDELRYFDAEALREKERALEAELIDALSARVAERVFEKLIERIP